MWKQLTQRARKAIFLAHEEAERLGYNHVASEHLLLALVREDDCVATRLLNRLGIDSGTVRARLMKELSRGSEKLAEMQLAPDAKHVIDFAFNEVKLAKDDWVGTEHLLLGLFYDESGKAFKVLRDLGVDLYSVREQLAELKAGRFPYEGHSDDMCIAVSAM